MSSALTVRYDKANNNNKANHKNYNFLACDWFKNVLFSTSSLAKLLVCYWIVCYWTVCYRTV